MRESKQHWTAGVVMSLLIATTGAVGVAQTESPDTGTSNDTTETSPSSSTASQSGTRGGNPTEAPYDEMAVNKDAEALLRTLSEERAEIRQLLAQQAAFRKMGGSRNLRISRLLGRMAREHTAAAPKLEALIRRHAGNPELAVVRKSPVLGSETQMLHATHKDHQDAVINSQARYRRVESSDTKAFLQKRANLSRKHIRLMSPYMRHHS